MPTLASPPHNPLRFRTLFPAWRGSQPVYLFMLENLLEARRQSSFPTNLVLPDEDVNVYLAHLLTEHLTRPIPAEVQAGSTPLLLPLTQANRSRWLQYEIYRRNGDHRLLCLGLYGRGDLKRRRFPWYGLDAKQTEQQDLVDGAACYTCARALVRRPNDSLAGVAEVLQKLAAKFPEYVEILQILARFRFDLGSRLSEAALDDLVAEPATSSREESSDHSGMDQVLDCLSDYRREPSAGKREELLQLASRYGIDPDLLLHKTGT
ncbi:MAG: hypothetical protein ABIF77_04315 [bacterium]